MLIRSMTRVVAIVAILSIVTIARADWTHTVGRYLGVGWSDGYHSRYACPPRPIRAKQHVEEKLPWWATPAADAEQLPQPPTPANASGAPAYPPAGASLFRSPGEGSSVIESEKLP